MRNSAIIGVLALAMMALCGCADTSADRDLSHAVARGAAQYNEAYGAAVNAMVLQNILRARDRLPRQYTLMSEVQINPTQTRETKGGLTNLPVGKGGGDEPWSVLELAGTLTNQGNVTYKITPPTEDKLTKGIYNPIDAGIFENYFNRNFPNDILFETMISVVEPVNEKPVTARPGRRSTSPRTPAPKKAEDAKSAEDSKIVAAAKACDALKKSAPQPDRTTVLRDCIVHVMIVSREKFDWSVQITESKNLDVDDPCKEIEKVKGGGSADDLRLMNILEKAKALGYKSKPDDGETGALRVEDCDSNPGVLYLTLYDRKPTKSDDASKDGETSKLHFKIVLRPFDQILYSLGARLRDGRDDGVHYDCDSAEEIEKVTELNTPAQKTVQRCATHPVLSVTTTADKAYSRRTYYVARVEHAGKTYVSGTQVATAGMSPSYDRSASTLTLLDQLLALAQSPDSVQTPAHIFVN